MPYSVAVKMLIENNIMNTPEKEKTKKGGIGEFLKQVK